MRYPPSIEAMPNAFRSRHLSRQRFIFALWLGSLMLLAHPIQAALLLQYNFDEATGTALDSSGTSPQANAAFTNSATRTPNTPSGIGYALDVSSGATTNNYLFATAPTKLNVSLTNLTLTTWINLQSNPSANDRLMGNITASSGFDFYFNNPSASAAQFGFRKNSTSGGTASATGVDAANKWVFVAVVYDGSNVSFYTGTPSSSVGQLGANSVLTGNITASIADFRVGSTPATSSDRTPPAWFDDVRVHNTALSLAQLESIRQTNLLTGNLSIKFANSNLIVSWPTSAVYYVLQSTTNLFAALAWKPVTNSVSTSNRTNQVTLNVSGQTAFFRLASAVDPSTMNHKLLMGYQGWFAAPGDGAAINSWVHWFGANTPTADNAHFDFWPDTSELDADELFSTSMTYSNGTTAKLYSAYKQKTVVRHFKWMQENNLDGVFLQRFLTDIGSGNITALRNQVATNVRVGAETYGRVFAMMYDISGYATNTLVSKLTNDWTYLVATQRVTSSSAYLRHQGKPVVAIWGFGFNDAKHLGSPQQAQETIDWFKAAGCTVMGGLPTNWRTLTGDAQTNVAWASVFRSFDVISPWTVGRYSNNSGADSYRTNYLVPDLADCTSHGIDYLPVIFPGFSWTNLNGGPFNQIPRNGGNFYWRQAFNAVQSGCAMIYGAMFDEVDEGTAMYKCVPTTAQLPAQGKFVPLNVDGYNLGSDWYLRLADQAGKMLRGETPVTNTIPITPP
jgi:hypothetical protein